MRCVASRPRERHDTRREAHLRGRGGNSGHPDHGPAGKCGVARKKQVISIPPKDSRFPIGAYHVPHRLSGAAARRATKNVELRKKHAFMTSTPRARGEFGALEWSFRAPNLTIHAGSGGAARAPQGAVARGIDVPVDRPIQPGHFRAPRGARRLPACFPFAGSAQSNILFLHALPKRTGCPARAALEHGERPRLHLPGIGAGPL